MIKSTVLRKFKAVLLTLSFLFSLANFVFAANEDFEGLVIGDGVVLGTAFNAKSHLSDKEKLEKKGTIEALFKKAEEGDRDAQYALGQKLILAEGGLIEVLKKNTEKGLFYLDRLAKQGDEESNWFLGLIHFKGFVHLCQALEPDHNKAFDYFKALKTPNYDARLVLGKMYREGKVCPQDLDKALELLQPFANGEFGKGLFLLGKVQQDLGQTKELEGTIGKLQDLTKAKGPERAFYLGKNHIFIDQSCLYYLGNTHYRLGQFKEARQCFEKLFGKESGRTNVSRRKHIMAVTQLAKMCREGVGGVQSMTQAFNFLKDTFVNEYRWKFKLAEAYNGFDHEADGICDLADMYYQGQGCAPDLKKATYLYTGLAQNGVARAEQSLNHLTDARKKMQPLLEDLQASVSSLCYLLPKNERYEPEYDKCVFGNADEFFEEYLSECRALESLLLFPQPVLVRLNDPASTKKAVEKEMKGGTLFEMNVDGVSYYTVVNTSQSADSLLTSIADEVFAEWGPFEGQDRPQVPLFLCDRILEDLMKKEDLRGFQRPDILANEEDLRRVQQTETSAEEIEFEMADAPNFDTIGPLAGFLGQLAKEYSAALKLVNEREMKFKDAGKPILLEDCWEYQNSLGMEWCLSNQEYINTQLMPLGLRGLADKFDAAVSNIFAGARKELESKIELCGRIPDLLMKVLAEFKRQLKDASPREEAFRKDPRFQFLPSQFVGVQKDKKIDN